MHANLEKQDSKSNVFMQAFFVRELFHRPSWFTGACFGVPTPRVAEKHF